VEKPEETKNGNAKNIIGKCCQRSARKEPPETDNDSQRNHQRQITIHNVSRVVVSKDILSEHRPLEVMDISIIGKDGEFLKED